MGKRTIAELDAGRLGLMCGFLQFKKRALSLSDIDGIESNLNSIRQIMLQNPVGQDKYGSNETLNLDELGTYINNVVIYAMGIMLDGGFDTLKESIRKEQIDV